MKSYLKLSGKVIDGTGKSNVWMPSTLPNLYPGTLNILLDSYRPDIQWHTTVLANHARWDQCEVKLGNILINNVRAHAVMPPKFKYVKRYNWLEVGHPEKLRDILNLENESLVTITFIQGIDKNFI